MKQFKRDLESLAKNLGKLQNKIDQMTKRLDSSEKAQFEKPKTRTAKKAATGKRLAAKAKEPTATGLVFDIIKKSKKGVDTATLREKTGFAEKRVYNCIFILKKKGMVKSAEKGVYVTV